MISMPLVAMEYARNLLVFEYAESSQRMTQLYKELAANAEKMTELYKESANSTEKMTKYWLHFLRMKPLSKNKEGKQE
jgi:hypothetical protein